MKKILIISFSPIARDPRVLRQIKILKNDYNLSVIGFGRNLEIDQVVYFNLEKESSLLEKFKKYFFLLFKQYEKAYWGHNDIKRTMKIINEEHSYDLVIANDIDALPVALKIAGDAPVLFDAHEYYPGQFGANSILNKYFIIPYLSYLCTTYISKASAMTTVSDGLADEYEKNYHVKAIVVTNAPVYEELEPQPLLEKKIKIIHHGSAAPNRNIELMIKTVAFLDKRFSLDLMLISSCKKYYNKLKCMAEENSRVNIVKPVRTDEIVKKLNEYDIGLYILKPMNFNQKYALPNKIFEFIQGRLCIAIGPSTEMENIVNKYNLGVVAGSFEPSDMAKELNKLTEEDVYNYKTAAHQAARELSAEKNSIIIKEMVNKLIN